jgi:ubiquinone/menaquinone biosynthesis C-methylase UbiE/uncharacterized protein YbaR (Trm112 family)
MGRLQPLSAKLGEVKFRQKLVKQHLGKRGLVPEEPSQKEILKILQQRVNVTRKIIKKLKKQDFLLSPYLEIGAEKAQRSMVLANEFKAQGFALDLSQESLSSAKKIASLLGFKKLPTLVCADIYQLPFADNSFPFVFTFETLHHFPDPKPVIKEIYRVLAPGGVFYFGEEPVKQAFNLNLWRRGYHLASWEKTLKLVGILPFVSRIGGTEVSHGILEEEFSLPIWKKALSLFTKVEAVVKPVFFGPKSSLIKKNSSWQSPQLLTQALIALQGGGVEALCLKKGKPKAKKSNFLQLLVCPDCHKKLKKNQTRLQCSGCLQKYLIKNGILYLLPQSLMKKLYP